MNKQRLIAVHLLNDFSGSPLVLRQSLEALRDEYEIHLYTATPSGKGFLSDLNNISTHSIAYRWSSTRLVTLFLFLYSQLSVFFTLLFRLRKSDIVYINTLLPFGAAWAAYLRKCKIVYHIHEVSIRPAMLKKVLCLTANQCATSVIFVSAYVRSAYHFRKPFTQVIHNALPDQFSARAGQVTEPCNDEIFTIAMLCSAKGYKGIYEFAALAKQLCYIRFELVLNGSDKEREAFIEQVRPSSNFSILPVQADTIPVYRRSHVVVNMSRPEEWVETFGMTVLEAMACGRPVIVPPVGGVCELVTDGIEGFHVDGKREEEFIKKITAMYTDPAYYTRLGQAARRKARCFSQAGFRVSLMDAVKMVTADIGPAAKANTRPPVHKPEENSGRRNSGSAVEL